MIKAVIIDDEPLARELIVELMASCASDVEVVGQGGDVAGGLRLIRELQPDLLLLDVQLLDGTSFDLLRQLDHFNYKIIFITAFEEYAIQAFRFSAIDFILKPVDPDDLREAIRKARQAMARESLDVRLQALFQNLESIGSDKRKIVLRTSTNYYLLNLSDIIRCQSDKNYTHFFTVDHEEIIVSKTLKEYEELLEDFNFIRIHQSHLVNLNHIRRYDKSDGGQVVMSDNSRLPVSFRKKEELMKFFERLHV
jgi:two-component system, LytTR family, response regulator